MKKHKFGVGYEELITYEGYCIGDTVEIISKPLTWASSGGDVPLRLPYPTTGTILGMAKPRDASYVSASIEINGKEYGFSINDLVKNQIIRKNNPTVQFRTKKKRLDFSIFS